MKRILAICILCLVLFGISNGQAPNNPFILGVIDTIDSKVLNEKRTLNIYLPKGYSPDSAAAYPVIYLLDGSADEDFIHVVGLVQYYNSPWINRFPRSIVVGIANTNRKKDFTFPVANLKFLSDFGFDTSSYAYGGSGNFISFIEDELQPYITKNYKANNTKTIIGQSLGGLLATEILLKKTNLFSTYIILSPSLWWDKESLLRKVPALFKPHPSEEMKIYIGVGNEGKVMVNDAKNLFKILKKHASPNIKIHLDHLPKEDHGTISHQALYNAFQLLYPIPKN